ncbi:hypothetical protein QRX50_10905 [Amycolatopsis carbonis]|uniref:Uncharacterized protein n=1 Tax=Amycolatopsis carbonis TaxID=715471 RepID=A0A9Y2IRD5_9PSEU|nr:hypothetical protein [Amycolatopsis sp. 2-15]WIX83880.1 hypothetical protein QRX50_10905 [Amycolatopsis sp. 2-15]
MQPVVEAYAPDGFALWPVSETAPDRHLALSGELTPLEVGTVLRYVVGCNDIDPGNDGRPPRPADALGSFLHGLLTFDSLFAAGGLKVTDTATGVVFRPGCCNGLEEWRDWNQVFAVGGSACFGHDPSPCAERDGEIVRLTVDAQRIDSPVIDVPTVELRHLLAGVERDLAGFLALATDWAYRNLPRHAFPVISALIRVLDLPGPGDIHSGQPARLQLERGTASAP